MAGVLDGLKVIDMGHVVAVPAACAMLGDWGADVIKIEPLTGEMQRGFSKMKVVNGVVSKESPVKWFFHLLNRNKRGVALDLKQDEGQEILVRLVKNADVFLSNYEAQALKNLKCDYNALRQINPRLIYGTLTGYGTEGPDKDERGFDFAAGWARSGAQYLMGEPGTKPSPPRGGMTDRITGGFMVAGVLAALLKRAQTGLGQEIDFSLYHTGVWVLAEDLQIALSGSPVLKHEHARAKNPLWNNYCARDGRWFQLVMLQSDLQWPGLCQAIGRPDFEKDPRFDSMESRTLNCEELIRYLDEIFATRTRPEWETLFRENGVIYGCVQTPEEVINDPQALANNFFVDALIPDTKDARIVATPVKFRQYPASVRMPAPELGQHTEEVLLDLGYDWGDITQFKDHKVIL